VWTYANNIYLYAYAEKDCLWLLEISFEYVCIIHMRTNVWTYAIYICIHTQRKIVHDYWKSAFTAQFFAICVCSCGHSPLFGAGCTPRVAACCSVQQCGQVCSSVLQCVAVCCLAMQCVAVRRFVLQCVLVCCSVLQRVAACRSVLQCVAVLALCCSELQYAAVAALCACVGVCVCVCVCIRVCVRVRESDFCSALVACIFMYSYKSHACVHTWYAHIYTYIHICTNKYYSHVYTYIYIHIYYAIYTHIHLTYYSQYIYTYIMLYTHTSI